MYIINLKDVCKTYNKSKINEVKALDHVHLQVEKGELVAILGTSGAGKTTLLNVIACLDRFDSGSYDFDGTEIRDLNDKKLSDFRNEKVGIVMQDFTLIEEYTVLQNVLTPLFFSKVKGSKQRKSLAEKTLSAVGILGLAKQDVKTLSGGQKQRTAIARAIVNNPQLILADEPTGALDSKTSLEIIELFKSLNQVGRTIVIVTHDPLVAQSCPRILNMEDGVLTEVKNEYLSVHTK
jgi:putative ABC transport system ATP-binding protein